MGSWGSSSGKSRSQVQWLNGVDHGRVQFACNGRAQTACFLSSPERFRHRLESLVLGSIAYWHDVWRQESLVPSGRSAPSVKAGAWEISDAANYAHLIKTIAFRLIHMGERSEWKIIRERFPKEPRPAPPLPTSVLRALGLG